jgi:hypothetical protein
MKRHLQKLSRYLEHELFGPSQTGTSIDLNLGGGVKIRSTVNPDQRPDQNSWMLDNRVGAKGWGKELQNRTFPNLFVG